MSFRRAPATAERQAARMLPGSGGGSDAQIRHAAWVARCVGPTPPGPCRRQLARSWPGTTLTPCWSPIRRSPAAGCPAWPSASRRARQGPRATRRVLASAGRAAAGQEAVDGRVEVPQRTLAATLGVAWPSLNKVLKDLERDGLIRIGYAAIEVLDRARLASRA